MDFTSTSVKETLAVGKQIGSALVGGEVISLRGSLGVGKTVLAKGIATALGIDADEVVSPSFTLIQEYDGTLALAHLDLYRLDSVEEFEMIGGEEFLYPSGVTLIEWADKVAEVLPEHLITIEITRNEDESRSITVSGIAL